MMKRRHDVIVVGGGTAGCVAAARLCARQLDVLLLEQGPDPQPTPEVVSLPAQAQRVRSTPYVKRYTAERSVGGPFDLMAGRILGGGSAINALSITRPLAQDFADWTAAGNAGWSWADVLPVLKRIERNVSHLGDPLHGDAGPLYLEELREQRASSPIEQALAEAAAALGLPEQADINGRSPLGLCPSTVNIKDGKRVSVVDAYLAPLREDPHLTLHSGADVTSLVLSGRRVQEVRYTLAGKPHVAQADRVLLCAGAVGTAQLLLLSGIGPSDELQRCQIAPTHPLPGVGHNLQDHATVVMKWQAQAGAGQGLKESWLLPVYIILWAADSAANIPDYHIIQRAPVTAVGQQVLPFSLHLLSQDNRGRVSLRDADPASAPRIEPRLLEAPADQEVMLDAMRLTAELARTPAMSRYYGRLLNPTAEPGEDHQAWRSYMREQHISYNHPAGTCKMGPDSDPMAVVDAQLRVHGLDNLFVGDMSIAPTIPRAQTNLSAMLIGERAADFLAS